MPAASCGAALASIRQERIEVLATCPGDRSFRSSQSRKREREACAGPRTTSVSRSRFSIGREARLKHEAFEIVYVWTVAAGLRRASRRSHREGSRDMRDGIQSAETAVCRFSIPRSTSRAVQVSASADGIDEVILAAAALAAAASSRAVAVVAWSTPNKCS